MVDYKAEIKKALELLEKYHPINDGRDWKSVRSAHEIEFSNCMSSSKGLEVETHCMRLIHLTRCHVRVCSISSLLVITVVR